MDCNVEEDNHVWGIFFFPRYAYSQSMLLDSVSYLKK